VSCKLELRMLDKNAVIEQASALGFQDVGFTTALPFESQGKILDERNQEYAWALESGLDLVAGIDPRNILATAQSIIVLMEPYFREAFPLSLESHFGRCYLDDDRVIRDRLTTRIRAFRGFLREHGVKSKVPFNLPHRLAAARAGMGTLGKNCLFYSRKVARQSSWVLPIAFVVDYEFTPDEPTIELGCPDWCKNVCIAACPIGALRGPRKIDPRKCISYLTYYAQAITPLELREPMGLWIYGCDRCQNVCPRNAAWLAKELPVNEKVQAMVADFEVTKLLHMDQPYFDAKIWPHMFYDRDLWKWKMNAARAIGNTLDPEYVPELIRAFGENDDERVLGMIAWALGRIGGSQASTALNDFLARSDGATRREVLCALAN
jgi:epoxyqueuosine reductase